MQDCKAFQISIGLLVLPRKGILFSDVNSSISLLIPISLHSVVHFGVDIAKLGML